MYKDAIKSAEEIIKRVDAIHNYEKWIKFEREGEISEKLLWKNQRKLTIYKNAYA